MELKNAWILSIYLFIPILFGVVLVDILFGSHLKYILPGSPHDLALFNVFFQLPHIIGSSLSLFDSDYLTHYKNKIWKFLSLSIILSFGLGLFVPSAFLILIFTWTLIHVLNQQLGILSMMIEFRGTLFKIYKYLFLSAGILGSHSLFFLNDFFQKNEILINNIYYSLIFSLILISIFLYFKSKTYEGSLYLIANTALILFSALCFSSGYMFFYILAFRLIHDLTGFLYYITHDTNRNTPEPKNIIFKILKKTKIPTIMITPIVSIFLALPITVFSRDSKWIMHLMTSIVFFHYLMESFMWKKESIHRKNLKIQERTKINN